MAKILIVDDSTVQRRALCEDVVSLGLEIREAKNGEEALQAISEEDFECIITDLLMPVMDGVEFLQRIRSENYDLPVIAITANSNRKKIETLEDIGVSCVMTKPHDSEELKMKIREVLSERFKAA